LNYMAPESLMKNNESKTKVCHLSLWLDILKFPSFHWFSNYRLIKWSMFGLLVSFYIL
jgi:hypothetical protein